MEKDKPTKGAGIEDANPNMKVSDEFVPELHKKFGKDLELKEAAEKVPVGVNTIATAVGEDPGTIEEVCEPFLIQEGFIMRTPRGRECTDLAYKHLGKTQHC